MSLYFDELETNLKENVYYQFALQQTLIYNLLMIKL